MKRRVTPLDLWACLPHRPRYLVLVLSVLSCLPNVAHAQPINNDGTATDIIFNLPATNDIVFLEDNDATPTDGMLRLRSASTTFDQMDFVIPTGSLTINLGAGKARPLRPSTRKYLHWATTAARPQPSSCAATALPSIVVTQTTP